MVSRQFRETYPKDGYDVMTRHCFDFVENAPPSSSMISNPKYALQLAAGCAVVCRTRFDITPSNRDLLRELPPIFRKVRIVRLAPHVAT